MKRRTRGLHELYREDPRQADQQLWGRTTETSTRRGFLRGLGAMSAAVGADIVFAPWMPAGLIPAVLAQSESPFTIEGKDGLLVLNDRPVNAETPPHLLNDPVTPASRLFVRNNGIPPVSVDVAAWQLTVDGESATTSRSFSIAELKQEFNNVSRQLWLECGGNGRSEFFPPASGNQWSLGAVGCPEWQGVLLRDVLQAVGVADNAVYIGYEGADVHASGDPTKQAISRGVPIDKAMGEECLVAWGMNGGDLPAMNGHPLRLVIGGWPGSCSGKWLNRIMIRDRVHDGAKMEGSSYRVPCAPVEPGATVEDDDMCIIEAMPVKSLITYPETAQEHPMSHPLEVNGHAWAGDGGISRVDVSIDFGQTWQQAALESPVNYLAWQHWQASIMLPQRGYFEVWARATDDQGRMQPMVLPGWNPKGYLNNACHRIAVYAV